MPHYSKRYFKGVAGWLVIVLHMQTQRVVGQPVTHYSRNPKATAGVDILA